MKLIRELFFDPAREIVEGRVKPPTVRTVPYVPFRPCPPKPPEETPLPAAVADQVRRRYSHSKVKLRDLIEAFRRTQPGEFTVMECVAYCLAGGYGAGHRTSPYVRWNVASQLRALKAQGLATTGPRQGRTREVKWRFVPLKPATLNLKP